MQIHFLLAERLDGYVFNPHRPEGLSFTDAETGVTIEIRAGGKDSDFGFGHRNLEIRATISCDATERQIGFVDALLNDRIVTPNETPITLPHNPHHNEVIGSDGEIVEGYSPTADFLPEDLQALCISSGMQLEKHAVRFVQLLRWHEKAIGPVKVIESRDQRFRLYWRTTQERYHSVPWPHQGIVGIGGGGFGGLTWSAENQQVFARLWGGGHQQEPLGQQLLREAKAISKEPLKKPDTFRLI